MDWLSSVASSLLAWPRASVFNDALCLSDYWLVPVVGNVVNTATAAGLTEAIGHLAMKKFEVDYSAGNEPIKASKVAIA